jgi:hypothetical protein
MNGGRMSPDRRRAVPLDPLVKLAKPRYDYGLPRRNVP